MPILVIADQNPKLTVIVGKAQYAFKAHRIARSGDDGGDKIVGIYEAVDEKEALLIKRSAKVPLRIKNIPDGQPQKKKRVRND